MIIANPIYDVVFKYLMEDLEYEVDPKQNDALVAKIMNGLARAVASDEVRLKMRIEDELERTYHKDMRAKDEIIEEKEQIIEEKEQIIEKKEQIIEEKEQIIEKKDQMLEQKDQEIKELRTKTEDTSREMAQLKEKTNREMTEMREQMALLMQQLSKK